MAKGSYSDTLTKVINACNKKFGEGSLVRLGDAATSMDIEFVHSGSLSLDRAIGGGIPVGRTIEFFGPEMSGKTTLAQHVMREFQKRGRVAALIDAEHTFNKELAVQYGLDVDNILLSQPSTGEEALDIAEAIIRSGDVGVVVIDSVSALTPKKELEGEMSDQDIALQARMMSKAMRKLTAALHQNNCTAIFINQLREKVGVMYGCLHGNTRVNFVDGRSIPIREVVENKITGQVWSFNEATNEYEPQEITDWHYNGRVESPDDYICICANSTGGHRFHITVTPDHMLLTDTGWQAAKDITLDSKLSSKYESIINGTLADFLWGSFIGDSTIEIRNDGAARYALQDKINPAYLQWKLDKLAPHMAMKENMAGVGQSKRLASECSYELVKIKRELGNRDPLVMLTEHYSDLGMAIWYMDDGWYNYHKSDSYASIGVKRFKDSDHLDAIADMLRAQGFNVAVRRRTGTIAFTKAASDSFFGRIAKYVPAPMQYKLPMIYRGMYEDFDLTSNVEIKQEFVRVISINKASNNQMRVKGKYDISVAKNHNYVVGGSRNGVVVHNSPEVTSGGRALKFYATVRVRVAMGEKLTSKQGIYGHVMKFKVVKNKVSAPFRDGQVNLIYGSGFDNISEVADMSEPLGIVTRGGAWYNYTTDSGEALKWQGLDNFKKALHEDEALRQEITAKFYAAIKINNPAGSPEYVDDNNVD